MDAAHKAFISLETVTTPHMEVPSDPLLREFGARIHAEGGRALLVGGAVRDALLGSPSKDLDIEVYGIEQERLESILSEFGPVNEVGRDFAVYKLGGLDIALPRTEVKEGTGHRGFDIRPDHTLTPERAALRRDFTMNAISMDIASGEVLDPTNGVTDIRRGVLRHVGPAFAEDPLRVLRGAQFAARFRMAGDAETIEMCRRLRDESSALARERIADEWEKLLGKGVEPSAGLRFLQASGWLPDEVAALAGRNQTPSGHDAFTRACMTMDRLASSETLPSKWKVSAQWTALTHEMSDDEADNLIQRLVMDKATAQAALAIRRTCHALTSTQEEPHTSNDEVLRRLADGTMPLHVSIIVLHASGHSRARMLRQRAKQLGVLHAPLPRVLSGEDVMALGVPSGRVVGAVLRAVREAQYAGRVVDKRSALREAGRALSAHVGSHMRKRATETDRDS